MVLVSGYIDLYWFDSCLIKVSADQYHITISGLRLELIEVLCVLEVDRWAGYGFSLDRGLKYFYKFFEQAKKPELRFKAWLKLVIVCNYFVITVFLKLVIVTLRVDIILALYAVFLFFFLAEWKEKEKPLFVLQSIREVEERRLEIMMVTLHSPANQLNLVSVQIYVHVYDKHFIVLCPLIGLTRIRPLSCGFDGSVERALHWHRRGRGFKSHSEPDFFFQVPVSVVFKTAFMFIMVSTYNCYCCTNIISY